MIASPFPRRVIARSCFICNIEREDFEQLNLPFKHHVHEEHNLWDYAFFRLCVATARERA